MDSFMESQQAAMEWLHATVSGMVDSPASIFITTNVMDTHSTFDLKVADSDIAKIIGRNGQNARALRTIFYAMGRKAGTRYELNIPERGLPPESQDARA